MTGGVVRPLSVLVAVRAEQIPRYREYLKAAGDIRPIAVASLRRARDILWAPEFEFDVVVIEAELGDVSKFIEGVRRSHPELIIILVDEEADFGTPGYADDITTAPFENDDLLIKIRRLIEERRLETLRSDALPPVRSFARRIRQAEGKDKVQAAVEVVHQLDFDYVVFFATGPDGLKAEAEAGELREEEVPFGRQIGPLVEWVSGHGMSRIVGPGDESSHPLLSNGYFDAAAAVPVGTRMRIGVILACRRELNSISGQDVMILELVAAQLASALAAEERRKERGE